MTSRGPENLESLAAEVGSAAKESAVLSSMTAELVSEGSD